MLLQANHTVGWDLQLGVCNTCLKQQIILQSAASVLFIHLYILSISFLEEEASFRKTKVLIRASHVRLYYPIPHFQQSGNLTHAAFPAARLAALGTIDAMKKMREKKALT